MTLLALLFGIPALCVIWPLSLVALGACVVVWPLCEAWAMVRRVVG